MTAGEPTARRSRTHRVTLVGVIAASAVLVTADRLVPPVGRLAYLFILVGWWAALLIAGIHLTFRLLRRFGLAAPPLGPHPLRAALALLASGIVTAVLLQFSGPPPVPSRDLPAGAQLRYLYETDQGDRAVLRFLVLAGRDARRLERVQALAADGQVVGARDAFHAALVLHHGTGPAHYARAHRFATQAEDGGARGGRWLRRATYDRWMVSLGQPQRYGTQSRATVLYLDAQRRRR